MAVETYNAACPFCGYKASDLEVTDINEKVAVVSALATCRRCRTVLSQEIPPRLSPLRKYRNQVKKAVQHMDSARERYLERMRRRVEELEPKVHTGEATLAERERLSNALSADRETGRAETGAFKRTLQRIEQAIEHASDEPVLHTCGEALTLHEETISGYSIDCPRCGEKMVVRLVGRR